MELYNNKLRCHSFARRENKISFSVEKICSLKVVAKGDATSLSHRLTKFCQTNLDEHKHAVKTVS